MKALEPNEINEWYRILLEPHAGAEVGHCARRAAVLALVEGREVAFVHNDRRYFAKPNQLIDAVMKTVEPLA